MRQLSVNLAELQQGSVAAIGQKPTTEDMEDCPLELRKNVAEIVRKIEVQMIAARNRIKYLQVERDVARAEGVRLMVELLTDFLQL